MGRHPRPRVFERYPAVGKPPAVPLERTARIPDGPPVPVVSRVPYLTPRERDIVRLLVAESLRDRAIAERLGIRLQTVRNILSSLYQKLGGVTRVRLVLWARKDIRFLPSQLGPEAKTMFRIYINDRGRLHGAPLYSYLCEVDAEDGPAACRMLDPKYGRPQFAPVVALKWPLDRWGKRWILEFTA